MKVITLTQPWASLVACGAKKIETRSWPTKYRGLIAIHAAANFPKYAVEACRTEPFEKALAADGKPLSECFHHDALPFGSVIAVCRITACEVMTPELIRMVPEPELSFGLYEPGRFMWMLADAYKLTEPIPVRGFQRIWNFEDPQLDVELELKDHFEEEGLFAGVGNG